MTLRITQQEFDDIASPLELDLMALFNLMEEDIQDLQKEAIKEHWTPERLLIEIDRLFV